MKKSIWDILFKHGFQFGTKTEGRFDKAFEECMDAEHGKTMEELDNTKKKLAVVEKDFLDSLAKGKEEVKDLNKKLGASNAAEAAAKSEIEVLKKLLEAAETRINELTVADRQDAAVVVAHEEKNRPLESPVGDAVAEAVQTISEEEKIREATEVRP